MAPRAHVILRMVQRSLPSEVTKRPLDHRAYPTSLWYHSHRLL